MVKVFQMVLHSILTFIDLAALAALVGVSLCLFWTARSKGDEENLQPLKGSLRRLLMLCYALLVISSITNMTQRIMEMSGLGITAVPSLLPTVLFKTHYGMIGLVRAGGLGLVLATWVISRGRLNSRFVSVLLFCAFASIAFSRGATSHASDYGDLSMREVSDWFHLMSVSIWGGALIVMAIVFRPSVMAKDRSLHRIVAGTADKFYVLLGPVLSLLVLTGVYNAWIEVRSFGLLLTTPYGRVLSVKIALLIILVFRYIAPPEHGQDDSAFAIKFARRTRVDAIMISGVLLCAAILTHNIPAHHFMPVEHMSLLISK
jgi:putative copper resistance protein D